MTLPRVHVLTDDISNAYRGHVKDIAPSVSDGSDSRVVEVDHIVRWKLPRPNVGLCVHVGHAHGPDESTSNACVSKCV